MSTREKSLLDQFASQSRVIQWGAIAAVFIVGFVAWDTFVRPVADNLRAEADQMQGEVELLNSAGLLDEFRSVSPAVLSMGDVVLPDSAEEESQRLVQEIQSIANEFGTRRVAKFKLDRRTSVRLRKETMAGYARGKRLEKVVADIEFESTTEDAIAFLEALESSPEIESLTNLRMTKTGTNKRVQVRLSAEAWGFASGRN